MTAVETVDGPERFGVPYHRDTVRIGPFEKEPLDLWYLLDSASTASGCGIRVASAEWLLGALEAAGVDVRAFDRSAVRAVAQDCGVEQVQVFAGWLARAGHPGPVSARTTGVLSSTGCSTPSTRLGSSWAPTTPACPGTWSRTTGHARSAPSPAGSAASGGARNARE